jgi:hypothetical protein
MEVSIETMIVRDVVLCSLHCRRNPEDRGSRFLQNIVSIRLHGVTSL